MNIRRDYNHIISLENLIEAWQEFLRGKKNRKDVAEFSLNLSKNIFILHKELQTKTYVHGGYEGFAISDPKPRSIHKATVRDRLLHHAIYRVLYPYIDSRFIYDSYSCREKKGTHRANVRFKLFARKVSKNNTRNCFVLKCDIRKFFASIDHQILMQVFKRHIVEPDTLWLIERVVESFESTGAGKGLPLGNLTSQLLVNIYLNEFDQFVKHSLKEKFYIRYADDFVFMSDNPHVLREILPKVQNFLRTKLKLTLHPHKVSFHTVTSGVDFLGWVHFPYHSVLRTSTKKRMFRNIEKSERNKKVFTSYIGMLSHGNTYNLQKSLQTKNIRL